MTTILFIGDIVGPMGVTYLEDRLPALAAEHRPDFILANAENTALHSNGAGGSCGMRPDLLDRLFTLGIDLVTGGNHSWDGPHGRTIHADPRVVRPLNVGRLAPGRGAAVVDKGGVRLGVINLISGTAMQGVDSPLDAVEQQLAAWQGTVDATLVDFHGESVMEKLALAFAFAGRVTGVFGTHTHVPTLDTRILPGGTAYVTDVGMTGPGDGIQGYAPDIFVNTFRLRLPSGDPLAFASGAIELGAVVVRCAGGRAVSIERVG
jgi:metallophosphoesterase (TIGR00282 family)